ncbi:MAG: hypothetical protein Q4F57_08210 [Weeksellaceae bacterium]|nr:hypothetical protein [Weeksellaceae bacterium]
MSKSESEINENTTISEAIQIFKDRVDALANSEEAAKYHQDNPSWSSLFRANYKPYQDAVANYEEALKVNEWLNGKSPENGHLTLLEVFMRMSDQQRLSLFHKRINSETSSIFDKYLRAWWINRY